MCFRNKFCFSNGTVSGKFISECINIVEKYIIFLEKKGKIFLPFDFSPYDAAIDITADIFKVENNTFVYFLHFFETHNINPSTEQDAKDALRIFLTSIAKRKLTDILADSDPDTGKIIRNIRDYIRKKNYYVSYFFSDKFFHKSDIIQEANSKDYAGRDNIIKLLIYNNFHQDNIPEFLENVFYVLENQYEYVKTISQTDAVWIYKYLCGKNFISEEIITEHNYSELSLIIEDEKKRFLSKLEPYFNKKNFSDFEKNRMYMVLEEWTNNVLNGGIKCSPAELTKKYFGKDDYTRMYNKVEYCINLLMSNIKIQIKKDYFLEQ